MITPVVHTVDRRKKDNNIPRNAMTQNEEYKQANDDDLHGLIYPKEIPRGGISGNGEDGRAEFDDVQDLGGKVKLRKRSDGGFVED